MNVPSTKFIEKYRKYIVHSVETDTRLHYTMKFTNNFGVSVVWEYLELPLPDGGTFNTGTYGSADGLWEVALIKWYGDDDYDLDYDHFMSDVAGYLDELGVDRIVKKAKAI